MACHRGRSRAPTRLPFARRLGEARPRPTRPQPVQGIRAAAARRGPRVRPALAPRNARMRASGRVAAGLAEGAGGRTMWAHAEARGGRVKPPRGGAPVRIWRGRGPPAPSPTPLKCRLLETPC